MNCTAKMFRYDQQIDSLAFLLRESNRFLIARHHDIVTRYIATFWVASIDDTFLHQGGYHNDQNYATYPRHT